MTEKIKIIYGHAPHCTWCYGLAPALEAFSRLRPDINMELAVGGLFKGNWIGPYTEMERYFRLAFGRVQSQTEQYPAPLFFTMINDIRSGLIQSATPNHVLLQVIELYPVKAVTFALSLQKAYFAEGKSLNCPETYRDVAYELNISNLDIAKAMTAHERTPLVKKGYWKARSIGIKSFPSCQVMKGETQIGTIDGIYQPAAFLRAFENIEIRHSSSVENVSHMFMPPKQITQNSRQRRSLTLTNNASFVSHNFGFGV